MELVEGFVTAEGGFTNLAGGGQPGAVLINNNADNLLATMDRFAADLGSASAELDHHIRDHAGGLDAGFLDFAADDLFFNVKGRLYGYTMILRALREDFAKVITERQIDAA